MLGTIIIYDIKLKLGISCLEYTILDIASRSEGIDVDIIFKCLNEPIDDIIKAIRNLINKKLLIKKEDVFKITFYAYKILFPYDYENKPESNETNKKKSTRTSQKYQRFRFKILDRDGNKCTSCGSKENLLVHHIKSEKTHPELLMDENNCVTLCRSCHKN